MLLVLREPNRRKVAPSELLNDHVAICEHLTNVHWVVAADLVVRKPFVLRRVAVFVTIPLEAYYSLPSSSISGFASKILPWPANEDLVDAEDAMF